MLIQLPTETWMEILNWLRRRDLIKKMDKLWDRQFTPIIQEWLYKFTRNVKIGKLAVTANGLNVQDCYQIFQTWEKVPIAEVEIPENIISFEAILIISELDQVMLAFLYRMRSLFRNICLDIYCDGRISIQQQTNIFKLMSLIAGRVQTIILDYPLLEFLAANFPASIRSDVQLLCIRDYKSGENDLLINWIFTQRQDYQPRTLVLSHLQLNDDFCTKIRKHFFEPTRQYVCPFFVRIDSVKSLPNDWTMFSNEENFRTGEQLKFCKTTDNGYYNKKQYGLIISYCPSSNVGDNEWLNKKITDVLDWDSDEQQQVIDLHYYGN